MKEFEARVRLNEENGGKTGELDIMSKPPFDKGYFNGVTYEITFKEPVFEAEKKSGWIPCSERLPEDGQLILVTLNQKSLKGAEYPVIIAKYTTEKDSWIHTIPDAVFAWMPLPEPYKQEDEHGS